MNKKKFLQEYILKKAESFIKDKAPNAKGVSNEVDYLLKNMSKDAYVIGFLEALYYIPEIEYMLSQFDVNNEQLN